MRRCVRSTTKGRILWTLRMAREVAEVDILSARAVTLSTSQVDIHLEGGNSSSTSTSFKFYGRLLHRYSGVMRVFLGGQKGCSKAPQPVPISGHSRRFHQLHR